MGSHFLSGPISYRKMIGWKDVVTMALVLVLSYDCQARRLHLNRADFSCVDCDQGKNPACIDGNIESTICSEADEANCYMRVVSRTKQVTRGCLLDIDADVADICLSGTNELCKTCNSTGCNNMLFPEGRRSCLQCNLEACSEDVKSTVCNLYEKNDKCVSLFDGFKLAKRTCQSLLTTEERPKCDGSDPTCSLCGENGCNTENVRPDDKCYTCTQNDQSRECLDLDSTLEPTLCPEGNEGKCFTKIAAKMISRGCFKDLNTGECVEDCKVCNGGNACNSEKKFPENRILCHQCTGAACEAEDLVAKACKLYEANDKCVTIFNGFKIQKRACLSELAEEESKKCESTSVECKVCDTDGCNNQIVRDDDMCVQCSQSDDGCVDGKLEATLCPKVSEQNCYSRIVEKGGIERGCLSSLEEPEIAICSNAEDQSCAECKGGSCNMEKFPENRLNCLQCTTPECTENLSAESCKIYDAEDKCVTLFDGFKSKKQACLTDLNDDEKKICQDENDATCTTCNGDGCNKDNIRSDDKCIECDQETNTNCLDLVEVITPNMCTKGNEGKCYTTVTGNQMIKRGCYVKLEAEEKPTCDNEEDETCAICDSGNGCNKQNKFPSNRLTCNECEGESCKLELNAKLCPLYDAEDKCVTLFDEVTVAKRTCRSNLDTETKEKCDNKDETCTACSGDSCNTATTPGKDDKCIQCTQTDPKCIEGLLEATECQVPSDGQCYKRVHSNGQVDRGCLSTLTEEIQKVCKDENDKTCHICDSGETCNGGVFPEDRLKCIKCGNTNDCKGKAQVSAYCTLYQERDRCVSLFGNFTVTKKACLSEITGTEANKCLNLDRECAHCGSENCNRDDTRVDDLCHSCKQVSGQLDNCLINPKESLKSLCAFGNYGQCYSRVVNGLVERGCRITLPAVEMNKCHLDQDESCNLCSTGNGCNNEIFPKDRIKCYKCKGTEDSCVDKQTDETKTILCNKHVEKEQCYLDVTTVDSKTYVNRGCLAEVDADFCKDKDKCQVCEGTGCNSDSSAAKLVGSLILLIVSFFIAVKNC